MSDIVDGVEHVVSDNKKSNSDGNLVVPFLFELEPITFHWLEVEIIGTAPLVTFRVPGPGFGIHRCTCG